MACRQGSSQAADARAIVAAAVGCSVLELETEQSSIGHVRRLSATTPAPVWQLANACMHGVNSAICTAYASRLTFLLTSSRASPFTRYRVYSAVCTMHLHARRSRLEAHRFSRVKAPAATHSAARIWRAPQQQSTWRGGVVWPGMHSCAASPPFCSCIRPFDP